MKKYSKLIYPVCFVLLIAVIAFLSFYKLDVKYVDPWDEARHGVNAYEMANGGSLFQNTYLRQADYYNLKPPLSMWCIMLGMAIFGNGVFALRFYSALCYVILAIVAGVFVKKAYGTTESLLATAFLAVNVTPFQAHMIRAGDADSLFVLLFTLAMICMMQIPQKKYNLYLCGLFFSLAFLAKSFHAGIIAVIGALYLILTGQIKKLTLKNWMLFLASVFVPLLLWAVPRAMVDGTVFFQKMWETDVLGRTDGTLQNNIAPFSYYAEYYLGAMSGSVTPYLCAFVICLVGLFVFNRFFVWKNREHYIGWILWILVPFVAFSIVKNKLLWYMYPVLVPLLLAAGIVTARIIKCDKILPFFRTVMSVAILFILLYYGGTVYNTIEAQEPNGFQELIKEVAAREEYKGLSAFVDYHLQEDGSIQSAWSQQDVFVAEAYGDFICQEDGVMGLMLRSTILGKKGILFAGEDVCAEYETFYSGAELIAETDGYRAYLIEY
ncbi:MAG: glycosyltransferase family 39 protein [Lachnospiraceae bacterium]|nr:glycosyltransferase family 39 protein [Lachnospiraceae bacterium]